MSRILRVPDIARFGRVPVPHTNEATYVLDAAGGRWIAKREADMGYESLLAEALTWLLALEIGAPVPDAAFCEHPAERAWLSRLVPNASHWSPATAAKVDNVEEAGAIHALDALVCNEARHGRNLVVVDAPGGRSRVIAIDADEALIGHPHELELRGGNPPDPRILARGIPAWRAGARLAAARAAGLSREVLTGLVSEACDVAREPDVDAVSRVLVARCAMAEDLTSRYLDLVEKRL